MPSNNGKYTDEIREQTAGNILCQLEKRVFLSKGVCYN